ncbi:pseudaminic acid cytidylyltransferase [Pararhizobium sp. BT-229]|uniref:pseudaminic acid cytidylyltransferase n=1 Tax=Pararhizobium sp. BT-229 TaxID=2986923 RepID=UPI0021F70C1D|nr:pseudaminic acid cytidylyltransferase [Pararhizobium sp. BT-229]MCV9962229.1 pseudaminic acid cytidylyltransferase [Pararhizobium sp. BT-229]
MQIAIIPARGGSKRIPRKNIKLFGGRPMIAWPIRAALSSKLFDHVIVSTDDDEIAEVAEASGASVPFRRPAEFANDHSPARDAINDTIAQAEAFYGKPVVSACCIYATSPLIEAGDLIAARALLDEKPVANFVFAAATYPHPVQRAMVRDGALGVSMLHPEHIKTRSQDLPEAFHDAGQFYWGWRDAFMDRHPMFSPQSRPYLLPRSRVQDIDTPEDWEFAELLFAAKNGTSPAQ